MVDLGIMDSSKNQPATNKGNVQETVEGPFIDDVPH